MEDRGILDIAKALSDDLRIRIVEVLVSGRPRTYTEIMKILGLDVVEDSSNFAYHIGILTETGIVEKVQKGYRITKSGREVFAAMDRVSRWTRSTYQEALKRLSGWDMCRLIWVRDLLFMGVLWLFPSSTVLFYGSIEIAFLIMVIGFISISLGAYWLMRFKGNFGNDLWKVLLSVEVCPTVLGRNGRIVSLTNALNTIGYVSLLLVLSSIGRRQLSINLLTLSFIFGSLAIFLVSIYLCRKIAFLWESVSIGTWVPDSIGGMGLGYKLVAGSLIIIGVIFILYGVSQLNVIGRAAFGWIGSGGGCFGAAAGIWGAYKRIETDLS